MIREGTLPPDDDGRRPDDQLVAVFDDESLARRVAWLLNEQAF